MESATELEAAWPILVDLHQRRRKSLGEPGCFASNSFYDFHRDVAERLLKRGQLRLSWLTLDGMPAAAEYHFADRIATLTDGVISDKEALRYTFPGMWRVPGAVSPVDSREHIVIHLEAMETGIWAHTHGLVKFGRPEMDRLADDGVPLERERRVDHVTVGSPGFAHLHDQRVRRIQPDGTTADCIGTIRRLAPRDSRLPSFAPREVWRGRLISADRESKLRGQQQ